MAIPPFERLDLEPDRRPHEQREKGSRGDSALAASTPAPVRIFDPVARESSPEMEKAIESVHSTPHEGETCSSQPDHKDQH